MIVEGEGTNGSSKDAARARTFRGAAGRNRQWDEDVYPNVVKEKRTPGEKIAPRAERNRPCTRELKRDAVFVRGLGTMYNRVHD